MDKIKILLSRIEKMGFNLDAYEDLEFKTIELKDCKPWKELKGLIDEYERAGYVLVHETELDGG